MDGGFGVWAIDLDLGETALARLLPLLSADEMARARRFVANRDRARYVARRAALRQILGHCLDRPAASLRFSYSSHGKPMLAATDGEPTLQFNASGSEGLALVAVHPSAVVGVDLERVRKLTDLPDLARMLLSEAELSEFDQVPSAEQAGRFLDCWTRKEALSKAHGTGLRQRLEKLSLHPWPGQEATRAQCSSRALWVAPLALPRPGHVAALASPAEIGGVHCEWWSPRAMH